MSSCPYFSAPCQVGVPGARTRHRRPPGSARSLRHLRLDVHRLLPIDPVAIADEHGDGCAGRPPVTDACDDFGAVTLDRHAAAASVAALPPAELRVQRIDVELKSRGHAVQGHDERLAMRLARSEKSEHSDKLYNEETATFCGSTARSRRNSREQGRCSAVVMTRLLHDRYVVFDGARGCDLVSGHEVMLDALPADDPALEAGSAELGISEVLDHGRDGEPRWLVLFARNGTQASAIGTTSRRHGPPPWLRGDRGRPVSQDCATC